MDVIECERYHQALTRVSHGAGNLTLSNEVHHTDLGPMVYRGKEVNESMSNLQGYIIFGLLTYIYSLMIPDFRRFTDQLDTPQPYSSLHTPSLSLLDMSSTPQAKTRKVGRPRLDKYNRLINRLYEAMGVLFLKQKTQGPHLLSNRNDSSITAVRRRLQKNLGFILDWSKGGESTISIAIQDHSRAYIYWVAVNQSNSIKPINLETNILPFLRKVLTKLRDASRLEDSSSEQVAAIQKLCAKECCEYADKRLKKEQRILFNGIQRSLSHLKESDTNGISFSTASE